MLTPIQQKWVDHLSDVDTIKIFPFDRESEDKFQKLKAQIESVIGNDYEILHRGASALKISGQKELDVYIPVSIEEMEPLAQKMETVFGKPKSVYPERIKFFIYIDGIKAETMLYDKNHSTWIAQEKFFKLLKDDSKILEQYKNLKEEGNDLSVREYYRRKIEFINDTLEQRVIIIDAVPEDAVGITDVFYKAWLATYPNKEKGITIEDIEDSYKDEFSDLKIENLKKIIRELPNNKKRLVAKVGNLIVGTCTVIKNESNNHLRTLYVLPEFQNKGVGTKLWNEANKFLDPQKDTIVQVADYTENAINFYKKLGFEDTGKRTEQESGGFKSGAIIIDMEMIKKHS